MQKLALVLLLSGALLCTLDGAASSPKNLRWTLDPATGCSVTDSGDYNLRLKYFSQAVLGKYDSATGCVTTPYLSGNYDPDCSLGICSMVHAGTDLRSREEPAAIVRSFVSGIVSWKNLDPAHDHSTLVIETADHAYKVFFLHMAEIFLAAGDRVSVGTPVGRVGAIGTETRHLHIEVWPRASPLFETRRGAVSGSACATGVCTLQEVETFSVDPLSLVPIASTAVDQEQPPAGVIAPMKTITSFDQIQESYLIESIRRTYAEGGLCARYYQLQNVRIVRRPNPRQANSVVVLLGVKITATPQTVPMEDSVVLSFCFGGGNTQQISDIGRVKHIVAGARFELVLDRWTVAGIEWNPAVDYACFCPWVFVEDIQARCGCGPGYN